MADNKLVWDVDGTRDYETGIREVALFVKTTAGAYGAGIAWNGVTSISENPSGADETALYADDIKYASLYSAETYGFTINAYQSPEEFDVCDGMASPSGLDGVHVAQQKRRGFGIVYKTQIGSDTEASEGYKLHLVWNCMAAPSSKEYSSINDSPDAIEFSWECTTTPTAVTGHQPTSYMVIDSRKFKDTNASKLTALENYIYGSTTATPAMPTPDQAIALLKNGNVAG